VHVTCTQLAHTCSGRVELFVSAAAAADDGVLVEGGLYLLYIYIYYIYTGACIRLLSDYLASDADMSMSGATDFRTR